MRNSKDIYPKKIMKMELRTPDYLSIVWEHLTKALCAEVFTQTRDRERQRKWTLFALVWFWLGLLQSRYTSQTRALLEGQNGNPLFPAINASPESFFMKVQTVRPAFFRNIFLAFTSEIEQEATDNFQSDLGVDPDVFPHIYAVDGSRLAKVGRLMKVARKTTKAIIPGSMEAVYDLRRGILHDLWFDPDGCVSEISMFEKVIGSVVAGSLILADRYYPKPVIWEDLTNKGIHMVSRYNKTVKKTKIKVLSKIRQSKLSVDDWLVDMGGSQHGTKSVRLRWVHIWNQDFDIVLITNVLDPKLLSPLQLLRLYRQRWTVERMYLALKDVLDLNHLYNSSPAAVGQQVYATAILYNALRLAQSRIAQKAKIPPEWISVDKLFPVLIDNLIKLTFMHMGGLRMREKYSQYYPRLKHPPDFTRDHPSLNLTLGNFLVEKRSDVRKLRRYRKGRKSWTSFNKIPGAKKYVRN